MCEIFSDFIKHAQEQFIDDRDTNQHLSLLWWLLHMRSWYGFLNCSYFDMSSKEKHCFIEKDALKPKWYFILVVMHSPVFWLGCISFSLSTLLSASNVRIITLTPEAAPCWPIRGQYSGHMINLDQSEASIHLVFAAPMPPLSALSVAAWLSHWRHQGCTSGPGISGSVQTFKIYFRPLEKNF